ncbi:MAG: hypothetical protein JXA03_13085 [Bacteroidales bacterium]|nr:hypothetical protein [Bacteroidales bacterium]
MSDDLWEAREILFDSSRKAVDMAAGVTGNNPGVFKKFFDLAIEDSYPYSMRAARVVYLAANNHPELIRPFLPQIAGSLHTFRTDGVKRCFAKILTGLTCDFDNETWGRLINTCFEWLMSPDEKVAQKVYAMDILYKSSALFPGIIPELIASIEEQMPRSSVGFASFGKKVLKKLIKYRSY